MAELKQIVRLLERQRRELVEQLAAVDKAIAALVPLKNATVAVGSDAPAASSNIPTDDPPATTLPRRVKPKRVLTDVHKQALMTARRKAREAHEVAKGRLLSGAAPTVSNQTACPHGACAHARSRRRRAAGRRLQLASGPAIRQTIAFRRLVRARARQPDGPTISSTVLWPVPQWQEWVCQLQIRRFQSSPWATSSVG